MRRLLTTATALTLLAAAPALAQRIGQPGGGTNTGGGGCTTNCTLTGTTTTAGITDSGGINTTGVYSLNGTPFLFGSTAVNGSTVAGATAGASLPAGSIFSAFFGYGAGALYTGSSSEVSCFGSNSCPLLTTGTFDTAIGQHAMGAEATANASTMVGNDTGRNYVSTGTGGNTSLGKSSMQAGGGQLETALGQQALYGNSGLIVVGGSATAGDTIAVTLTGPLYCASGCTTAPISITNGESTTAIATSLTSALNALTPSIPGWTAATSSAVGVSLLFNGTPTTGAQIVATSNITGAATETLTITGGAVGINNFAAGYAALSGIYSLSSAAENIAIGRTALAGATTTVGSVCIGNYSCQNATSETYTTAVGYNAGNVMKGTYGNTLFGWGAGDALTTGSDNVILGDGHFSHNFITTGANNVQIGANSEVPSGTGNNKLSIQNAIYGTGNSNNQGTASAGKIGLMQKTPASTLDVNGNAQVGTSMYIGVSGSAPFNALETGAIGMLRTTAAGTSVGAAQGGKILLVCGTTAGTAKLVAYAGTSTTPTTIMDNIGGGNSGC